MIEDPDKIRRTINLCVLFTRNMAYYRASYDDFGYAAGDDNFSKTISGNFIDISIIEWCKLFGAWGEHHHWQNSATGDVEDFKTSLLEHLSMTSTEFEEYHQTMINYRNVFAAHWDDDGGGKKPFLDFALRV